ncbi:MAG: hypothetical protein HY553_21545 [Elusimicrobia bacterium]|nr:hypothetical protein [Elusimicrobiota bacterium]
MRTGLSIVAAVLLAARLAAGQPALLDLTRLGGAEGSADAPPIGEPVEAPFDPFEPEGLIPRGPFKGRPVDIDTKRTLRILTDQEAAQYGLPPGERYVANFLHADKWWIAHVPEGGVEEVIVQDEMAPGSLGHGQMRLRMKPGSPVTLFPQRRGETDEPVRLPEIVWSAWGTGPRDFNEKMSSVKNVWRSLTQGPEQFLITYRLRSLEQAVSIMVKDGRRNGCRQFELDISEREANLVLDRALAYAHAKGMDEMFNLFTRSCVSELFVVLDGALNYGPGGEIIGERLRRIPPLIPVYLALRGLLKPGVEIQNIEDEFPLQP